MKTIAITIWGLHPIYIVMIAATTDGVDSKPQTYLQRWRFLNARYIYYIILEQIILIYV